MNGFVSGFVHTLETRATLLARLGAALIVLVGVGYSLLLGDALRYADERHYMQIAGNLLNDGEFAVTPGEPTAYRPPLYPMLLAAFGGPHAPTVALRVLNFVLLALSALAISSLASAAGRPAAAAGAPFVVLAYPLLTYTAGTFYPQTLAGFLLCAFVWLLAGPRLSRRRNVAAGAVLGLLILTVPLCLLLVPVLILWSAVARRPGVSQMLLVCAIAGLVTTPWLARNYAVFGEFPVLGTNAGSNLLLGNSENTTPNSGVQADISRYREQARGLDEVERNRYLMRAAVDYMLANPGRSAALYTGKLANWFNVNPNLATSGQQNAAQIVVLAVSYGALLALVVLRLGLARRHPMRPEEALTLLLYVAAAAAYALFFTRIRFRVPFDLLLVLPACHAVGILVTDTLSKAIARRAGARAATMQQP